MYTLKTLAEKSVSVVTVEEVRENERKDYNQREWNKTIDRYLQYSNVQFYKTSGSNYGYKETLFVVYEVKGIRFLQEVSYGSMLSNRGFAWGYIYEGMMKVYCYEEGRVSPDSRDYMEQQSRLFSDKFFTKVF